MYRSFVSDLIRGFLSDIQSATETTNLSLSLGAERAITLTTRTTPAGQMQLLVSDGKNRIEVDFAADPRSPFLTNPVWVTITDPSGQSRRLTNLGGLVNLRLQGPLGELHQAVLRVMRSFNPALDHALRPVAPAPAPSEKVSTPESAQVQPAALAEGEAIESAAQTPATPESAAAPESAEVAQTPEFRTWVIHRPEAPDLKFEGRLVASASTPYRNGRAQQQVVFETRMGKHVALHLGLSLWPHEHTRVTVKVADNKEALVGLLGYNALSKAVFEQLGVEAVETIQ